MKVVNLLEFLNKSKDLYTLEYSQCSDKLVNFLDVMLEDEQFTQKLDFGLIFIEQKTFDQYMIVDGVNRILSLSLLLHAICECYKKTTPQNAKAIKTIRQKYLISGSKLKLHLFGKDEVIYNKIINGERLSGHEKATPMFSLLHSFWTQIKNENIQASKIFNMLNRVFVTVVETDSVPSRDLYYKLNINRNISQILLIDDYVKQNAVESAWQKIKNNFHNESDLILFLNDFFITKFNYKKFDEKRLYENFVNYFETMLQYFSEDIIISKLKNASRLYHNMISVNFQNEAIKQAFIDIKKYSGDDTYPYLLDVYQDYIDNNISESTFIEILNTVVEYLSNRKKSGKSVEFNELIEYLNAFIACK